jgi:hypothetical protein
MTVIAEQHPTVAPTEDKSGAKTRDAPARNYDVVHSVPLPTASMSKKASLVFTSFHPLPSITATSILEVGASTSRGMIGTPLPGRAAGRWLM